MTHILLYNNACCSANSNVYDLPIPRLPVMAYVRAGRCKFLKQSKTIPRLNRRVIIDVP